MRAELTKHSNPLLRRLLGRSDRIIASTRVIRCLALPTMALLVACVSREDRTAMAVAQALADEDVRTVVRDLLREQRESGMNCIDSRLLSEQANLPEGLYLAMPRPHDRVTWDPTDTVLVVSPASSNDELKFRQKAFGPSGASRTFAVIERLPVAWLIAVECDDPDTISTVDFSNDFNGRQTISTIEEEFAIRYSDMAVSNPDARVSPTPNGTQSLVDGAALQLSRMQVTYQIAYHTCTPRNPCDWPDDNPWPDTVTLDLTYSECKTTPAGYDLDNDGLNKDCEYELAKAFAPILLLDEKETVDDRTGGRETYWEVDTRRIGSDTSSSSLVGVFYALGYYDDTGILGHKGDSEFVYLEVEPTAINDDNKRWVLKAICLSAHWDTLVDKSRCYVQNAAGDQSGTPRVTVSFGKHANYANSDVCDEVRTDEWQDTCPAAKGVAVDTVEVLESTRLGQFNSRRVFFSRDPQTHPGKERLWHAQKFCGWNEVDERERRDGCSTSYRWLIGYHLRVLPESDSE